VVRLLLLLLLLPSVSVVLLGVIWQKCCAGG
jgi:hypothetical protein